MKKEDEISGNPLLLYDGVCGFCNKSVQLILAHDKKGTLRFAPLQSNLGQTILAAHHLGNVDSIVFVERVTETERAYLRSTAALKVASYLGGWWKLWLISYIVPRPVRDLFYDLFARNRYRFFGKHDSCMLPPPEVRSRFSDLA